MKTALGFLLLLGLAIPALSAVDSPMSVFVVHCEPTNANELMWAKLVDLVALADQYGVPLTIDFTAQWAEMILDDEAKLVLLEAWLETGHEIAGHHHPYWTLQQRSATWDGYTDTPFDDILPEDRALYRGTMDDYMALLNALPGERRSGCFGLTDERDYADWPCQLVYATVGHALEEAVSAPYERSFQDCDLLEISHALIVAPARGALRALYEETSSDRVFGVVGHVYNYAEFPAVFEQWFAFLAQIDSDGLRRTTVSGLLDAYEAGEPGD